MFTFLSRFRRQTAVLTALALVASVLVAVPVSAADDDPKADYTATFSACVAGASEDAGFTDVPEGHANAGDIDCIAYYGITKGTSASTYSPLMSVTREHMALFLTRLAGLVGIEVASDPADPGFTDTGDLSEESQTAIAQLADLGITKGTSDTTYSPADTVTRGHMALFIARLMNKMDPMAEDSNNVFGYTPEDVGVVNVIDTDDNEIADEPGKAKSPFGDLQSSTKETYDAITKPLGVGCRFWYQRHTTTDRRSRSPVLPWQGSWQAFWTIRMPAPWVSRSRLPRPGTSAVSIPRLRCPIVIPVSLPWLMCPSRCSTVTRM